MSSIPWLPQVSPWSDRYITTVSSVWPVRSSASRMIPTLSSIWLTMPRYRATGSRQSSAVMFSSPQLTTCCFWI